MPHGFPPRIFVLGAAKTFSRGLSIAGSKNPPGRTGGSAQTNDGLAAVIVAVAVAVHIIAAARFDPAAAVAIVAASDGVARQAARDAADHGADDTVRGQAADGGTADGADRRAGVVAAATASIRIGGAETEAGKQRGGCHNSAKGFHRVLLAKRWKENVPKEPWFLSRQRRIVGVALFRAGIERRRIPGVARRALRESLRQIGIGDEKFAESDGVG